MMPDQEIQVLKGIGPIAGGARVNLEDFLLEVVVCLLRIGPGFRRLPEPFSLDLEVLEHCRLLFRLCW